MNKNFLFRPSVDSQLLFLVSVSSVLLAFVALMLFPLGLPYFEHIVGYWWANEIFRDAVGQTQKILWYKKTAYSVLFCLWTLGTLWIWRRLLRSAREGIILAFAYTVFCLTVIGSQYLVLGGWNTHSTVNLTSEEDGSPSIITVISRIDEPREFLKDMAKYAGVNGQLKGTFAIKAPGYMMMFYYADQIGQVGIRAMGKETSDVGTRAAAVAIVFTLAIGLFLIPMFYLLKICFSVDIAKIAVLILSMNPLAAHGFANMMAVGHHILIPVSALALLCFVVGRIQRKLWLVALSFIIMALATLIVWEAAAFIGILCFAFVLAEANSARLVQWNKALVLKLLGISCILLFVSWLVFKLVFGIDMIVYFWDHFVVTHLFVHLNKMFVNKGPIVYVLSIFTNPICFGFFLGVPLTIAALFSARRNLQSNWRRLDIVKQVGLATVFFVIALDLSGVSSETSRLWAFMAPAWYFLAFQEISHTEDRHALTRVGFVIYLICAMQVLIERNVHYSV